MIDLIFIVGLYLLIFGVLLALWKVLKELALLKAVLIPYFANLAKFLNPEKK